jgi:hypothetical protein
MLQVYAGGVRCVSRNCHTNGATVAVAREQDTTAELITEALRAEYARKRSAWDRYVREQRISCEQKTAYCLMCMLQYRVPAEMANV